jgi:hypothetical protein
MSALIREIAAELGARVRIAPLLAVVEHCWSGDDGTHHELTSFLRSRSRIASRKSRESRTR